MIGSASLLSLYTFSGGFRVLMGRASVSFWSYGFRGV